MAGGLNKVETAVHSIVAVMGLTEFSFVNQKVVKLFLYEIHDFHATACVVEKIAEPRRIDEIEKQIHFVFDQVNFAHINFGRLARLERWTWIVLVVNLAVE